MKNSPSYTIDFIPPFSDNDLSLSLPFLAESTTPNKNLPLILWLTSCCKKISFYSEKISFYSKKKALQIPILPFASKRFLAEAKRFLFTPKRYLFTSKSNPSTPKRTPPTVASFFLLQKEIFLHQKEIFSKQKESFMTHILFIFSYLCFNAVVIYRKEQFCLTLKFQEK